MENGKQNNTGLIIALAILVIIIIALIFGFGSYIAINNMKNELRQQQNNQVQEEDYKEEQNNNIDNDQQEDKLQSEDENIENNVEDSKENNNTAEKTEFKAVDGLGDKYVDFNNRSFAINGKVYTLGVHTLQDMINDGVPFDKTDLANANNNLNKNHQSQRFIIELDKYYSARVYFTNFSNENKKIADCTLSEIYFSIDEEKEQNILSFAFPLTITEDNLVSQAGQPTNQSEYQGNGYVKRTLQYTIDSTKYLGNSGYKFEFRNDVLDSLSITYKE